MSYTMSLSKYMFIIPNENIEEATAALKEKMTYGNLQNDSYIEIVLHSRSIETLMKLCGFTILCNKNGYVDIDVDQNCYYDYTKSAWYQELKRLPEYLLFEGEREMIKKW